MKRAQRTDLLREMKKSFNRYISILAIMALGVAFYAGVRSSEPDMQLSAKKYFDETNYMDIRVMGTLGMTEDDVKEIGAIGGVALAEGGYQTELFLEAGQRDYQMSVYSLGDVLNQVRVTEGRVPEAANECFVDRDFMSSCGYKVGDTITLRTDKDTELSDVLAVDTFTIVGAGIFPNYLSWQRGAVSIGTGVEDGFLFLPKEAFSMEVYTVVYAMAEGAKDLNPYLDEYETYIDEIVERIEAIADARCEIRYTEVTDPYWEDIREAEADIADGEKELADGEKELADAEKELADAEVEIADAEKKIADGEIEIADGEKELADALAEIKDGEQKLADAEKELADSLAEIEDGERQLALAKSQLDALGLPMTAELLVMEAGLADGRKQYEDGLADYEQAKIDLADGKKQYEDGLAELEQAKLDLEDGKTELADAKKKVEDAKIEIADAKIEIEDGKKELEDGKQELADAKAELEDVEVPEWYVLDRGTVQQLVEYGSNTERVGNLGDVFPAVFYLVAALVSLTTMTRMIEEERTQIGTMKALGYGKGAIVSKYLWYSLSATLLGGVLGIIVGSYLFPWVIMKAYGILYTNIPYILTPIQWGVSGISVAIAVICTVVATMSSCYKEMVAAPAILMRPVAPPAGRRVFLEYVKPVWNALNFSWKATCRNLFRYKKRFFMTIFGIGGCMALLLVGFGLRDSIMDIVNKQYAEVWTYDAYLSINDEAVSLEEKMQADDIKNYMFIHTKTMDVGSEENVVSSTLFVPERLEDLEEFVVLRDRVSEEKYSLTEENTIITEKLAKLLDVSVGDTIELNFDDVTRYQVTVDAIAENYMFHYVYLSAEKYEQLCHETPEYNQLYLKTVAMSEEDKEAFSGRMLSDDGVDSITYVEELQESVAVMMKSLEMVVVVLIIAAGMLAFIVLYNLNNINIIERRRELATLKVLGFFDVEVANYVYRENILLTALGILAGVVMGFFLHRFVILTVEIDMMMFGREIEWPSYLYSVLLTCIFAVLINFGMFYKLRKIDMVESLKSAE
ncbi:MAG: FtsX-like permease family protein [Lachnospiraceae bacterium]|nr:FtsX-like permease family protein [Lachnospiraceae bacterium]